MSVFLGHCRILVRHVNIDRLVMLNVMGLDQTQLRVLVRHLMVGSIVRIILCVAHRCS